MKNLLCCLFACFCFSTAFAQVQVGVRAGLSTTSLSPDDLTLFSEEGRQDLLLQVNDAKFGILFGGLVRVTINDFFIQPELIFTSNQVDFDVTDFTTSNVVTTLRSEKYQYLDIPIMAGYKFSFFRVMGGLEGHVFLNSTSDLFDFDNYSQNFNTLTIGWQIGAGVDVSKLMIDLRFQGNFSKFGNHINFAGREFTFDQSPARLMLSAGWLF